jgi:cellulose synthase/poly-beta-1,6-N-acetylglucosamine synthase-like glycosyltransferase
MTQDIEIVWRMHMHGYKARMCLDTKVESVTPYKLRDWWKQRIRWNIGGTQCILKYRKQVFKKGMLGNFIIPLFTATLFIGLLGLFLFAYLMARRIILSYITAQYSLAANTAIIRMSELSFTPSVLNFFGVVLFLLGLGFTLFALGKVQNRHMQEKQNLFNISVYSLIYLAIYPIIMVASLYKYVRGKYSW